MISKWLSAGEIARITGKTKRAINLRVVKERWVSRTVWANGGERRLYQVLALPEDIQTAYAASLKLDVQELQSQLKPTSVPEQKVNIPRYACRSAAKKEIGTVETTPNAALKIAALRKKIVDAYNASGLKPKDFIAAYENGVILPEVRAELGKYGKLHTQSTFYSNWLNRYAIYCLAGLAPQYAARRGGAGASLDEQAKDIIQALYLDPRKPGIAAVTRDIRQFGYELNYTIINRYIRNEIPLSVKVFYREGAKRYHDKFDPFIERDYTLFAAMAWGCADHHVFDFIINYNGKLCRPWLTMFIDMRSRKITGWHIDIIPSTLTILRALSMSVDTCGLFDNLLIDNGKDFKSAWLAGSAWKERRTAPDQDTRNLIEGVLQDCGTVAHFCKPYRGQSKPIERAFGTICEQYSKYQETYVGSNTVLRKADADLYWKKINGREKIEVTLTLEDVRKSFADFVLWFNAEWRHSGDGMNGRTPDAVFAETVTAKREMPEAMRKYVFARRETRVVQRNGVSIDGIEYYTGEMTRYIGTEVEVRRDIDRVGSVSIFDIKTRTYMFDAQSDVFKDTGVTEDNLRVQKREQKKAREHLKEFNKCQDEIRRAVMSPAEILAEKTAGQEAIVFDDRKVASGEPLAAIQKRRLRLPTDPD